MKRLVADLSLDKHMLSEALQKSLRLPAVGNWPSSFTGDFRRVVRGPVAKAVVISRMQSDTRNFSRKHGLTSKHVLASRIEEVRVCIKDFGVFPSINDCVHKLDKLWINRNRRIEKVAVTMSDTSLMKGKEISLKEVLARIPGLETIYKETYGEDSKAVKCSHFKIADVGEGSIPRHREFEVQSNGTIHNRSMLRDRVMDLRTNFPFLEKWAVWRANKLEGTVSFCNLKPSARDEFAEKFLREGQRIFYPVEYSQKDGYWPMTSRASLILYTEI